MAAEARVNVSIRFKRKWVLTAYANVAAAFGATECPEFLIRLAGGEYRIDNGSWRAF